MKPLVCCISQLFFTLALCQAEKLSITMPGSYPQKADDYICTRVPLPDFKIETGFVIGFKPIVNSSVHHMILSSCDKWMDGKEAKKPGPCENQCRKHILYAWAHHGSSLQLPEGSAFEIGRNTQTKSISMEVHYSRREESPDYATIELTYTRTPQPYHAGIILMYNSDAEIPPHAQHFAANISCRFRTPAPVYVIRVRTHAHDLNKAVNAYYRRHGERRYHILAKGNAQWPQTFYKPTELSSSSDFVRLQDGDLLMARCVYDSTNRNRSTLMGSTHSDEMCNVYLMYIMDSQYELPEEGEYCADEMVPGAWAHPPAGSLDYAPDMPPHSQPAVSSPTSIDFELDSKWHVKGAGIGKVSGVALTADDGQKTQLYILRRGENPWTEKSFDDDFKYSEDEVDYVTNPILHVDVETGRVLETFGNKLFILPHGLSIEKGENSQPVGLWVTDVALHQVMRFDWGKWHTPSLVLGKEGVPGTTKNTFCQPADVAVASTGEIFVADGYCNERIVKFSADGKYLAEWGVSGWKSDGASRVGAFQIVHSLSIIMPSGKGETEQICAADREHAQIDCYDLQGRRISQYDGHALLPSVYAITYSPTYKIMFGVTGPFSVYDDFHGTLQPTADLNEDNYGDTNDDTAATAFAFQPLLVPDAGEGSIQKHINNHRHNLDLEFRSPHDIDVSPDGSMLFVAEFTEPYVSKINIVQSDAKGLLKARSNSTEALAPSLLSSFKSPRTLVQKIIIAVLAGVLCILGLTAIVILLRSWRRNSRGFRNDRRYFPRSSSGKRDTRRRYDGFQPLRQDDTAQGLDSALFSDEEDEEDAEAGSTTIVDVRNFGLSSPKSAAEAPKPKINGNTSSNNHINT